jgi:hypothetical protein
LTVEGGSPASSKFAGWAFLPQNANGVNIMENLSIDISAEVKWSQWSRCESSFSMLLVPHRPGVLALAEDVLDSDGNGKRMLGLFYVAEAYDISSAVSELFSPRSPYREQLESRRCFARYAMISDPENRRAVVNALRTWMATQTEAATGITGELTGELPARAGSLELEARAQQRSVAEPSTNDVNCDCDPADCTHAPRSGTQLKRREPLGRQAFPAGF